MFAWNCAEAGGQHLGTCVDRFYFGSCCKLPDVINSIEESTNKNEDIAPAVPATTDSTTVSTGSTGTSSGASTGGSTGTSSTSETSSETSSSTSTVATGSEIEIGLAPV